MFRKISTHEGKYKNIKYKYEDLLNDFRDYAEVETTLAGKSTGHSGKPSSYQNYLIRLIILYNDFFQNNPVPSYYRVDGYHKLSRLREVDGWAEYNQMEGRFPSGALSCYGRFVKRNEKELIETLLDNQMNESLYTIDQHQIIGSKIEEETSNYMVTKREKIEVSGMKVYPRNPKEAQIAKQKNNWECEIDSNHYTFYSYVDRKPFMEAHHLIPMAFQDEFEYSIDFADNIVCLCPNCHRKVHYATNEVKLEMLNILFDKKKRLYSSHNIQIDIQTLRLYYDIPQ